MFVHTRSPWVLFRLADHVTSGSNSTNLSQKRPHISYYVHLRVKSYKIHMTVQVIQELIILVT